MEHQGVHKNLFRNACAFQDRIGIWKCWFLRRGENRSTRRKTSQNRVENQQQTQPTFDTGSRKQILVGDKRSHHCTSLELALSLWESYILNIYVPKSC